MAKTQEIFSAYNPIAMLNDRTARRLGRLALEGMRIKSLNGEVEMRKADHQLQQQLYVSTSTKVNGRDVKYDQENTGYGWKTNQKIESFVAM